MNILRKLAAANQWILLSFYCPIVLLLGFMAGIDSPTIDQAPLRQPPFLLFFSDVFPSESWTYQSALFLLYIASVMLLSALLAKKGWPAFCGIVISLGAFSLLEAVGRTTLLSARLIRPEEVDTDIFQQIAGVFLYGSPCIPIAYLIRKCVQKA